MQLRYAIMADFANVTQDGKVNVMGVFDRLFAQNFPAVHKLLFLVTSLESDAEDEGETRESRIQLIDQDGNKLTDLRGQINFAKGKQVVNQIHVFQDLKFSAPGVYQFTIFFEGRHAKTVDLELVLLPPTPTAGSL